MSKTAKVHGFTGVGETTKEARQDAIRQIKALQEGYWTPEVRSWCGETVIIVRTVAGGDYYFVRERDGVPTLRSCCMVSSFQEAVRSAERHLAQIGWRFTDPIDLFPDFIQSDDKRELIDWRKWQLSYRHLKNHGLADREAHQQASARHWDSVSSLYAPVRFPSLEIGEQFNCGGFEDTFVKVGEDQAVREANYVAGRPGDEYPASARLPFTFEDTDIVRPIPRAKPVTSAA